MFKMDQKWKYYGALAMLIWAYTAVGKPTGDTIKKLWIGYAVLGGVLGMNLLKFNDEDDNKQ